MFDHYIYETNGRCLIELLVIPNNTWKHETVSKQMINDKQNISYKMEKKPFNSMKKMSSGSFENIIYKMFQNHIFNIYV